jgi:hypothetical protein
MKIIKVKYFNSELMKELLDSEYKYEVTFQKILFLEKEKEALTGKFKDMLNKVEQRSGLRVNIINPESYPRKTSRAY